MTRVSVIIPVYNTLPEYIEEAISSVRAQTFTDFEIIVVDDGSTNQSTVKYLEALEAVKLLRKENGGLSSARNAGIAIATGEYIFPLDSDDKIAPDYLELAVKAFEENGDISIVYGKAKFFGVKNNVWNLPEFNAEKIKYSNMIYCSAMYRKADWEEIGGYKTDMIYGYEDWDFWLSFVEKGKTNVHRIDKILFYYRKTKEPSMLRLLNKDPYKRAYSKLKLFSHHKDLYDDFDKLYEFLYKHKNGFWKKVTNKIKRIIFPNKF